MAISLEKTIITLLENKRYKTVRDVLCVTNEADIAALFAELPEESISVLFRLLPKDLAADCFAMMEAESQEMLIKSFSDSELKEVFDELYVDDMVDILEEMPANVVKRILAGTDIETRKTINEILKYPEDSAGSLMTIEYITLRPQMTVNEAIKRIRRTISEKETVYNCYVTDDNRMLMGMLPIKTLLLAEEDDTIADIMEANTVSVSTVTDKEEVYKLMSRYDSVTLPVVDEEGRMVGIITFDDAIDVMQEVTTEDIERMAAMAPTEDSYFRTTDMKHAKSRIVWLLILMLSAAITGGLLTSYEEAFSAVPILVSFIPMIMGTGGNCGGQSSAMIIRGMSVDEIQLKDFFKVIWTEFRISLVISLILGIVNAARIVIMNRDLTLALVTTLAMSGAVVIAQIMGCILPMLAKKLKLDPAVMAAPLITTVVDAASVVIYFTIATKFFSL